MCIRDSSIVEGISFSDVLNSYGDFRAGDASKTAVTNYEKRHNLKDGKPCLLYTSHHYVWKGSVMFSEFRYEQCEKCGKLKK